MGNVSLSLKICPFKSVLVTVTLKYYMFFKQFSSVPFRDIFHFEHLCIYIGGASLLIHQVGADILLDYIDFKLFPYKTTLVLQRHCLIRSFSLHNQRHSISDQ